MKLRNSQIYNSQIQIINLIQTELFQFQVLVYIFEIHVIQKAFSKNMDPVTSTGQEKMSLPHTFSFSEIKVLL